MVRFLLEAGADQEHKTDEMHTALMEACMVSVGKDVGKFFLFRNEHFPQKKINKINSNECKYNIKQMWQFQNYN